MSVNRKITEEIKKGGFRENAGRKPTGQRTYSFRAKPELVDPVFEKLREEGGGKISEYVAGLIYKDQGIDS